MSDPNELCEHKLHSDYCRRCMWKHIAALEACRDCNKMSEELGRKDEEIRQLNAQKQAALDLLAKFAHTDQVVAALAN